MDGTRESLDRRHDALRTGNMTQRATRPRASAERSAARTAPSSRTLASARAAAPTRSRGTAAKKAISRVARPAGVKAGKSPLTQAKPAKAVAAPKRGSKATVTSKRSAKAPPVKRAAKTAKVSKRANKTTAAVKRTSGTTKRATKLTPAAATRAAKASAAEQRRAPKLTPAAAKRAAKAAVVAKKRAAKQAIADKRSAKAAAVAKKRATKQAAADKRAAKAAVVAKKRAKKQAAADKRVAKAAAIAKKRAAKQAAADKRAAKAAVLAKKRAKKQAAADKRVAKAAAIAKKRAAKQAAADKRVAKAAALAKKRVARQATLAKKLAAKQAAAESRKAGKQATAETRAEKAAEKAAARTLAKQARVEQKLAAKQAKLAQKLAQKLAAKAAKAAEKAAAKAQSAVAHREPEVNSSLSAYSSSVRQPQRRVPSLVGDDNESNDLEPPSENSARLLRTGVVRGRLARRDDPSSIAFIDPEELDLSRITALQARLGTNCAIESARVFLAPWLRGKDTLALVAAGYQSVGCAVLAVTAEERRVLVLAASTEEVEAVVASLPSQGLPLRTLLSEPAERGIQLAQIQRQDAVALLLSIDCLDDAALMSVLGRQRWDGVIILEGQRASELAVDFDVSYDRVAPALARLGRPTVLALVTGAAPSVRSDLPHRLSLRNPQRSDTSPVPPSAALEVRMVDGAGRATRFVELVTQLDGLTLVLCSSPDDADEALGHLRRANLAVRRVGASPLKEPVSAPLQALVGFSDQRLLVEVQAVNLVHYRSPASLEQYVRDLGWLAAQVSPTRSILLSAPDDENRARAWLDRTRPRPEELQALIGALRRIGAPLATVLLDTLAGTLGIARKRILELATPLARAGWLELGPDWLRLPRDLNLLEELTAGFAARIKTSRERDSARARSVAAYVLSKSCREEALRRHFGATGGRPCGRCDLCRAV